MTMRSEKKNKQITGPPHSKFKALMLNRDTGTFVSPSSYVVSMQMFLNVKSRFIAENYTIYKLFIVVSFIHDSEITPK